MEILINELSLRGQFTSIDEFAVDALPSLLGILKDINPATDQLFKKDDLYSSFVTSQLTLHDAFVGSTSRQYDEIRRAKTLLVKLFEDPYWEKDQIHSADSKYTYKEKDIWGTSLAESYEREKVVLSFKHQDYVDRLLPVSKDDKVISIDNLFEKGHYLELCWQRRVITFKDYCVGKFKGEKMDFSKIDPREGFNLINNISDQNLFFDAFRKFKELSWPQISVDDGLDYKTFNNRRYFSDIPHQIHKFRVSQRYRCFGYTHDGVFHVLMFDLDHKLSDQG